MTKNVLRALMPKKVWQLLSMAKKIVLSGGAVNLKNIKFIKNSESVIVLGNGPSLKNDLEKIAEKAETHDFVCVNNFCSSPYYNIFKPSMYVFLDGYFFTENAHSDWIIQRETTFKILNEKTNWKMLIILPFSADESILKRQITNNNILIVKTKLIGVESSHFNSWIKFIYDSGHFSPQLNNVLLGAIFYSIWANYKRILIYGADLSFHKDIEVNQSNNHLFMKFRHFNSNEHIEILKRGPTKKDYETMFYMLDGQAKTFKGHELISNYAKSKNIQIYNKSSFSYIDAYARMEK